MLEEKIDSAEKLKAIRDELHGSHEVALQRKNSLLELRLQTCRKDNIDLTIQSEEQAKEIEELKENISEQQKIIGNLTSESQDCKKIVQKQHKQIVDLENELKTAKSS